MQLIPFAIGLIGLLAVVIIGALWTLVVMTPMCILIGIAVLLFVRANRRQAAIRGRLARECDRERLLNDREYAAWQTAVEDERRQERK